MICVKNGLIFDAVHPDPYEADILVEDGKIREIGKNLSCPAGCEVIDATGKHVYPGFIDAHSHLGTQSSGIGFEGTDCNEKTDIITPHLRAIDGLQPMDSTFHEAAMAGVTTVCTGPGSANVLGGQFCNIKTVGHRVDDMVINPLLRHEVRIRREPKRVYQGKCNDTRMNTAARLREMLFKAKEYNEKLEAAKDDPSKKPAFDIKLDALLPVIRGEVPLKAHAHQANDFFTALRIAKEFGVRITLEHVTEGHLVVEDLVKENVPLAIGPSLGHKTKFELRNKTFETPGILAKAGCQVSIITDSPVIPQNYLTLCAALAIKSGMSEVDALRAITINPARHIGEAHRIGSLEEGKDADIVIMNGSCFEVATQVECVLIDGKVVE